MVEYIVLEPCNALTWDEQRWHQPSLLQRHCRFVLCLKAVHSEDDLQSFVPSLNLYATEQSFGTVSTTLYLFPEHDECNIFLRSLHDEGVLHPHYLLAVRCQLRLRTTARRRKRWIDPHMVL